MKTLPEEGLNIVEVLPKPRNKFYAFMQWKYLLIIFLTSILFYFFEKYIPNQDNFYSGIFIGLPLLIYLIYVKMGNIIRKENITYKVIGKMYFHEDFIQVNNQRKYLTEIDHLEINSYDFVGNLITSIDLNEPIHSLSISNDLTIYFKDETTEKIQFMQEKENQLMLFKKELVHYYNLKLIDELIMKRFLN